MNLENNYLEQSIRNAMNLEREILRGGFEDSTLPLIRPIFFPSFGIGFIVQSFKYLYFLLCTGSILARRRLMAESWVTFHQIYNLRAPSPISYTDPLSGSLFRLRPFFSCKSFDLMYGEGQKDKQFQKQYAKKLTRTAIRRMNRVRDCLFSKTWFLINF